MKTGLFRVISCGQPETYTSVNGAQGTKSQVILQEPGTYQRADKTNAYSNAIVATAFGGIAQAPLYPNEMVLATLRFEARLSNEGRWYQDIVVADLIKIKI